MAAACASSLRWRRRRCLRKRQPFVISMDLAAYQDREHGLRYDASLSIRRPGAVVRAASLAREAAAAFVVLSTDALGAATGAASARVAVAAQV